jgi:hypothetical protein
VIVTPLALPQQPISGLVEKFLKVLQHLER